MNNRIIVVSAVNLVIGGTLTILKDCLSFLSKFSEENDYRIIALVNNKDIAYYPNVEYIEIPWAKKNWIFRLYCEYVTMHKISRRIQPIKLWVSLHDTTPNVIADRRAVYCHNSFPFFKWKVADLYFSYKVVMFSIFSKYAYKINIKKNNFVIVQQPWFRDEFVKLFSLPKEKVIVAFPNDITSENLDKSVTLSNNSKGKYTFFFPSSANPHKNFELICEAAKRLEKQGIDNFQISLTINGTENRYAKWVYKKYSSLKTVSFIGFIDRQRVFDYYESSNCLVFPSRIESWGLPISEFVEYNKPILASDLQYAHVAAMNSKRTAFFNPNRVNDLSEMMKKLIKGDEGILRPVNYIEPQLPISHSWNELFNQLLR